jgi:hypothetical protein
MRGLAWVGCVLLVAACTRDNGAFEGDGSASSTVAGEGTRTDSADQGPGPGSTPGSGTGTGGADGTTTRDATTGNPSETTMNADGPDPTSTGTLEGGSGPVSDSMEGGSTSTSTGGDVDPPATCCMGESCNNPDFADNCVCETLDPACCDPGPWSLYCTALAVQECGLAMCIPPSGACCESHEAAGCNDFEVMACVCGAISDCCSVGWTMDCVAYADENCLPC